MSDTSLETEELFGFSELEDRLLGDDGPETLRLCLEHVIAIRADMKTLANTGLSPSNFEIVSALIEASEAAERILKTKPNLQGAAP